jgi:hypothetical protein
MARTTIEVDKTTKESLRERRLQHESNYNDTIERLLGEGESPYVTEAEAKEIVRDMVLMEALE